MDLDLLALAGGRDSVFRQAFLLSGAPDKAALAIVAVVSEEAARSLTGVLMAEMVVQRDTFVLLEGDRPDGPSDATDAWDEAFEAQLLPEVEKFAARAGVSQKWIVDNVAGSIHDDAEAILAMCVNVAGHMANSVFESKNSVNKKLSMLGITAVQITDGWRLLASGEQAEAPPEGERYDFTNSALSEPARIYPPEDVTGTAQIHAPSPVAPPRPAAVPVVATMGGGKPTPVKRPRGNKNASHVLPNVIFTTIRSIGIKDTDLANACGIPRSSLSRVADGSAEDIGLTGEQADALLDFLRDKLESLKGAISTLKLYDLHVELAGAA